METNLNQKQAKTNMGRKIMLIPRFVLKVINNERKNLTHHEVIDRIAQQIAFVITQMCKESRLWIHPNLRAQVSHLLIHLLLYCRCMDLRKGILFKKIRNHSQPLKLQQSNKICHKLT